MGRRYGRKDVEEKGVGREGLRTQKLHFQTDTEIYTLALTACALVRSFHLVKHEAHSRDNAQSAHSAVVARVVASKMCLVYLRSTLCLS